ncbi:MAG: SMI1/KNR4 family protein [Oscillospiraceae bacterium]|jgi:hypothetical protein|nr:SMI1/KNR4 family protein [Oscillospiraceae bacterium]
MKSIKSLRTRLTSHNTLVVQNEGGFVGEMGFEWVEPATNIKIQLFEADNNIALPSTYKDFLKISNGAVLFKDIKYGQWGCKIFGLDELIYTSKQANIWGYALKSEWLVFAQWLGDCDILVFDLNRSASGEKNYILDGEEGESVNNWQFINGSFEKWIDRLIVSQGAKYWRWY